MADTYSSSLLVNAQTKLNGKYNEAELRRKERPVLTLSTKNAQYTLPEWQNLKTAQDRVVEVKYKKATAAGSGTAKAHNHTGAKGATGTLNLAYTCFTETFYTSRKMAQNNVFGFEELFQHQLEQAVQNLKDRAETAGLAYLAAHTCQLGSIAVQGGGSWNGTNHALEIAETKTDRSVQIAKSFMRGRNFSGAYDLVADLNWYSEIEYTMWQGAGNGVNLNPQMQGVNVAATSETVSEAYTSGGGFIMPAGTLKALNWNDPLNVSNLNAGENNVGMLTTLLDPFGSGLVFDVSMYSERANESANGGGVQDVKDQWEIALWLGWGLPPISAAGDSTVHLVGIGN